MTPVRLRAELIAVEAELKGLMASWQYAFAMGGSCHGGVSIHGTGPRAHTPSC